VAGTSALGSIGIISNNIISVTLDAATSGLGSVTAAGTAAVVLEGVVGTTGTTHLLVWGEVDDSQTPNWSEISDSQTPSWSGVDTSQDPDWKEVA
jgi:hypothetical protein